MKIEKSHFELTVIDKVTPPIIPHLRALTTVATALTGDSSPTARPTAKTKAPR